MLSDDRKELVACLAQLSNDNYGGKKRKEKKRKLMQHEHWVLGKIESHENSNININTV